MVKDHAHLPAAWGILSHQRHIKDRPVLMKNKKSSLHLVPILVQLVHPAGEWCALFRTVGVFIYSEHLGNSISGF